MKGEHMKKVFTLIFLGIVMVGCRGKNGRDGAGGEMQSFIGITNVDGFGVQVDNFGELDEVTAYYALASATYDFFELKGPDSPGATTPYYVLRTSGSGVLVILNNIPIGSSYRILVWRPGGLI